MFHVEGPKTKGALKGWGNLSSSMSSTPGPSPMTTPQSGQKTRPVNTSSTFATFQRAAKEKADRCDHDDDDDDDNDNDDD